MATATAQRLGASAPYIAGTKPGAPRPDLAKYRSLGEVITAAQTDTRAASGLDVLVRAYTGATSADGHAVAVPPFVERDLLTQAENRPTWAAFVPGELPEVGKNLEFPMFAVSGDVAEQVNEGDDLTYLELVVTSDLTPVRTFGGYVQTSAQAANRGPKYLDRAFQLGLVRYARRTNSAAVAALGALDAGDPNAVTLPFADRMKAGAWIDAALSAAWAIQDNSVGLAASVWLMPRVQFRALANIVDTANRPVFDLDVAHGRGTVEGLEVVADGLLPAGTSWIASRNAMTVREDHPVRLLAKTNVVNLTKALPVYGYAAVEPSDVKGLCRITHAAA